MRRKIFKEPKFVPKPGQIDYTHIRRAPVINCIVEYKGKILIMKRSAGMRFYPGYWHCIAGFLDDGRSVEEKVREELKEELGIGKKDILSLREGPLLEKDEPKYKKTWIIHPVLVKLKTDTVKLNWEAETYRWVIPEELKDYKLMPGFEKVFKAVFGK